ncbi:MAG: Hsp70 family protein, partial [Mycobacterium sp.]|nr:Hsp70 family protein [Mycobacterium sp.]
MYDPLGLSIGTSNLVAVRKGSPPVTRRAVLTISPDRAPELGVPVDDPAVTDTGTVLSGFVEQVGRSNSFVSADGSTHDPALLLVEALDALVTASGTDASTSNITIAVPAHWDTEALRGLQNALITQSGFVPDGVAPSLVSDAVTALTALMSGARLPADGVVALVDFGGGGTSITLADAASGFTPIADTVRYPDFSGDIIDEALLVHVLEKVGHTNGADPASTAVVGQLAKAREQCRLAKERLSKETVTELFVELSGHRACVQVSRDELESLITDRLKGVLSVFDDVLRRNRVRHKDLAAVAMAGGVARLPFVAQHLSSHAKVSLVTAVQPEIATAVGAVVLSSRRPVEQQREEVREEIEVPTMAAMVGASTGGFATSTSAFGPPTSGFGPPTGGLTAPDIQAFFDADPSETMHELVWSQADDSGDEPVFYTGEPYDDDERVTPSQLMRLPKAQLPEAPRRGSRLPQLFLGVAALISMVAIGGVAFSLTSATDNQAPPAHSSTTAVPPPPRPSSQPPSPSPLPPRPPSAAAPPPSPAPSPAAAPPATSEAPPPPPPPPPPVTTYQPPPSTTQPPPSTAATTTPPPPTTTATTTPPPSASTTTPTTSVPMTTEYLRLPFVPV